MKTRASFLKSAFFMLLISAALVGCGNNNTSGSGGGGGGSSIPDPYGYGGFGTGYGSFGQILTQVAAENPCRVGGTTNNQQRVKLTPFPLNGFQISVGGIYVGVTPEGDIAVVSNTSGAVLEVHACSRPDISNQMTPFGQMVVNVSNNCPVNEITALNVQLQATSGYGNYILQFAPIHIPGTDRISSLCQ